MTQSRNSEMEPRRGPGAGWRRRGMTLLELLIVVAIITVLIAAVALGGKAVHSAMRRSSCEQQLRLIQDAIKAYESFWPKWVVVDLSGREYVIADRGWPDYIPTRLFVPESVTLFDPRGGPFEDPDPADGEPMFNDPADLDFTLEPGDESGMTYDATGDMTIAEGDVEFGAECLVYGLTAEVGKGPFITDKMDAKLQSAHAGELYPKLLADDGQDARARGEFVDPWGTLIRYFWVYADPEQDPTRKAYKGYLPVPTADMTQPEFWLDTTGDGTGDLYGMPKKAVGYVLESAGPDKKFGNVWKQRPTHQEILDAEDNLMVKP